VKVQCEACAFAERTVRLCKGADVHGFPQPDPAPQAPPPGAAAARVEAHTFCTTTDPKVLSDAFEGLRVLPIRAGLDEAFGRYLCQTLFGDHWAAMTKAAADGQVDLILRFPAGAGALERLPWELMHGPTGFVTGDLKPEVSVAREVPGAPPFPAGRTIAPRVLFVIGGDPETDVAIRAGYEYIGLLR